MAGNSGRDVQISGGIFKKIDTVSINVPSTSALTDVLVTFNVAGVKIGDLILLFADSNWDGRFVIVGTSVLTDGVVTVRFRNTHTAVADPPAATFWYIVIRR